VTGIDLGKQLVVTSYYTARNLAETGYDTARRVTITSYDTAKNITLNSYDTVKDLTIRTVDTVKPVAVASYDTARKLTLNSYELVNNVARNSYDLLITLTRNSYDLANNLALNGYDLARDLTLNSYVTLKNYAIVTFDTTKNYTASSIDTLKHYSEITYNAAKDRTVDSYYTAKNVASRNYETMRNFTVDTFNYTDKKIREITEAFRLTMQKMINDIRQIRVTVMNEIAKRTREIRAKSEEAAVYLTKAASNGIANTADRTLNAARPYLTEEMEKPASALVTYARHWQERVQNANTAEDIWIAAIEETKRNMRMMTELCSIYIKLEQSHDDKCKVEVKCTDKQFTQDVHVKGEKQW
jgi:hypothetical protein